MSCSGDSSRNGRRKRTEEVGLVDVRIGTARDTTAVKIKAPSDDRDL